MITNFAQLIQRASATGPRRVAVVLPSSVESLRSAAMAHKRGLAQCTLIGDVAHIRALAGTEAVDLSTLTLIDEPGCQGALQQAMHLCRVEQADVLVNDGAALHPFLVALLDRQSGLRDGSLLSGVSVFEWKESRRLLLLTDGIMVVSPDLGQRIGIVKNAIHVAHRLGIELPHVALVAATEMVNPKSQVTVDAAQITVMARRNQIEGAVVDGPLGLDNAISARAAEVKAIVGDVPGRADVIVAPDIEAGNLLLKTLSSLCQVPVVHAIVGAKVPIVLWSPHEDVERRLAAVALGVLCS
jgi:phosphate butyryltransferase